MQKTEPDLLIIKQKHTNIHHLHHPWELKLQGSQRQCVSELLRSEQPRVVVWEPRNQPVSWDGIFLSWLFLNFSAFSLTRWSHFKKNLISFNKHVKRSVLLSPCCYPFHLEHLIPKPRFNWALGWGFFTSRFVVLLCFTSDCLSRGQKLTLFQVDPRLQDRGLEMCR